MDYMTLNEFGSTPRDMLNGSLVYFCKPNGDIAQTPRNIGKFVYAAAQGHPISLNQCGECDDLIDKVREAVNQGLLIQNGPNSKEYVASATAKKSRIGVTPVYSDGTRYGSMAEKRPMYVKNLLSGKMAEKRPLKTNTALKDSYKTLEGPMAEKRPEYEAVTELVASLSNSSQKDSSSTRRPTKSHLATLTGCLA
jgi:hypothetical protein